MLQGRGAEVGVRAPLWMVRLCGAALCFGVAILCDLLGVWGVLGVSRWAVHLLAMVCGALLGTGAFGSMLWLVNGLLASALMVVMYTPLVRPLLARLVRADVVSTSPVDAVVVLSGGLTEDGRIGGQALDRLLSGMSLAKQRAVGELALSVVEQHMPGAAGSSEADQRALVQLVAPELTLRLVFEVHSTREEALAFAALARTRGWQRVTVVTSPMHTHRACKAIEMAGLAVECRPAAPRDYSLERLDRGEDRRLVFQDVLYETAAELLYRARGWM